MLSRPLHLQLQHRDLSNSAMDSPTLSKAKYPTMRPQSDATKQPDETTKPRDKQTDETTKPKAKEEAERKAKEEADRKAKEEVQ